VSFRDVSIFGSADEVFLMSKLPLTSHGAGPLAIREATRRVDGSVFANLLNRTTVPRDDRLSRLTNGQRTAAGLINLFAPTLLRMEKNNDPVLGRYRTDAIFEAAAAYH
jgi:hypothetical protein